MSSTKEFQTNGIFATNQSYSSTKSAYQPCFVDDTLIFTGIKLTAYTVIFLISFVLNSLTVFLVWRKKSMRKTINYFIVNMAVSDLIITSVYMPRQMTKFITGASWMVQGIFGDILCKAVPTLHKTAILASILTLLAMSVDRYCAVVFPMRFVFTRGRVRMAVILTWLVSIAARLPYLFALQLNNEFCSVKYRNTYGVGVKQIYLLTLLVTFCVVPLVVQLILYTIAIVCLKCQTSPGIISTTLASQRIKRKAARKLLKLTCSITVGFVACWTPYFVAQIAHRTVPCDVRFWRFFLAHSNSALNPLLCALFNPEFRQGFKQVLCLGRITRRNTNNQAAGNANRARQSVNESVVIERVTVL